VVSALIEQGVDAGQASANGTTPAILAAARNNVDVLGVLRRGGADLTAADRDGYAPCHAACASGSADALRYLLEDMGCCGGADADANVQTAPGATNLAPTTKAGLGCAALAAKHNRANVVECLSSMHQRDENAPDNNQRVLAPDASDAFNLDPPIHVAAKHGSVDAVRAFLKCSDCDTDARDMHGRTALMVAVIEGQVDVVKCFVDAVSAADFELFDTEDVTGMTPLYLAAKLGFADIVAILAPISDVNVMCLVEEEDVIVDGREAKATNDDVGDETPDNTEHNREDENNESQIQSLRDGFPRADRTVSQPPLLAAVIHNHVECARLLLDHGADVNQTDDKGHSALSIAARLGFLRLVQLMVSSGADMSLRSYNGGGTALQKAKKYRHVKIIELLEKQDMLNDSGLEGVV